MGGPTRKGAGDGAPPDEEGAGDGACRTPVGCLRHAAVHRRPSCASALDLRPTSATCRGGGRGDTGSRVVARGRDDGHFVPNLTVGPPVVASLRRHSDLFFDTHLMITDPDQYLESFRDAGSDGCTVHVEVGRTAELIDQMRGARPAGGTGGQPRHSLRGHRALPVRGRSSAVHDRVPRLRRVVLHRRGDAQGRKVREALADRQLQVDVEVDGGIDHHTVVEAARSGAERLRGRLGGVRATPPAGGGPVDPQGSRGGSHGRRPLTDRDGADLRRTTRVTRGHGARAIDGRPRRRAGDRAQPRWARSVRSEAGADGFERSTAPPGGPHAEVVASRRRAGARSRHPVRDARALCASRPHPTVHRRRTVAAGVGRVVVGVEDPRPEGGRAGDRRAAGGRPGGDRRRRSERGRRPAGRLPQAPSHRPPGCHAQAGRHARRVHRRRRREQPVDHRRGGAPRCPPASGPFRCRAGGAAGPC